MRYHDFRLDSYTVSHSGNEIVLHLMYDYPEQTKITSHIRFAEVVAHHFVHTGTAIITDIQEVSLEILVGGIGDQLSDWSRKHGGYAHWKDDRIEYQTELKAKGYRAWLLESATGFGGFVIAKSVEGYTT